MGLQKEQNGIYIESIFGAPGTGKTEYLMKILEKALKKTTIDRIAFISFTKAGAVTGLNRALEKFPEIKKEDAKYFRTLHSLAFLLLDLNRSDTISTYDYKELSRKLNKRFLGYYTEELRHNDDELLFLNELQRNNYTMFTKKIKNVDFREYAFISEAYEKYKELNNILDYTDYLTKTLEKDLFLKDVDIAIVDECQDLPTLQWKFVYSVFRNVKELYTAGDDDQAIFTWQGADINQFLNINSTKLTILSTSYRLPDKVIDFANKVINRIDNRQTKLYHGTGKAGDVYHILSLDELNLKKGNYFILSRNQYFVNKIEDYLQNIGLVYYTKKGLSIAKDVLEAIQIYERFRISPVLTPGQTLKVQKYATKLDIKSPWYDVFDKLPAKKVSYYLRVLGDEPLKADFEKLVQTGIYTGTIHSVKGKECDNIVFFTDVSKSVYMHYKESPEDEYRCIYVAITRAKERVFLLNFGTQYQYDLLNI